MQNFYSFSALAGLQARQATFAVNLPLGLVGKLFSKEDISLPADQRSQRIINQGRVNQIAKYILDNPNSYVLPPLVAYVRTGEIKFDANKDYPKLGELKISLSADLALFDGQHRCAAIQLAVAQKPFLADETITVYLLANQGVSAAQQIFADINMNAVKPAQSIKLLYNQRDQVTAFTKSMIKEIPLFEKYTDLERTNLPATSNKLFTFSGLYQANQILWNGLGDDPSKPITISKFWEVLIPCIEEWEQLMDLAVHSELLRNQSLTAHSVTWMALAEVGLQLIKRRPNHNEWTFALERLDMNWSRQNPVWQGRVILGGKICKTRKNILLMANAILQHNRIELSKTQQALEDEFLKTIQPDANAA